MTAYLAESERFSLGPGRPIPRVGDVVMVPHWSWYGPITVTEVFPDPDADGFHYVFRGTCPNSVKAVGVDRVNLQSSRIDWKILSPEPDPVMVSLPVDRVRSLLDCAYWVDRGTPPTEELFDEVRAAIRAAVSKGDS